MKKGVLILSLIISSFTVIGQSDTSSIFTSGRIGYIYGDYFHEGPTIEYFPSDNSITVVGDTIAAIRMLVKQIANSDSIRWAKEEELYNFVRKSVDFANNIPDRYKNKVGNCKWSPWYSAIRKYGYIQHTLRKPIKYNCR